MILNKQYGKGDVTVELSDVIQEITHSGPDIQAVMVLRADGNMDIWAVPGKPLLTAPNGNPSTEAPNNPMDDKEVRASNLISMDGNPSRIRVNGTLYYWNPTPS